MQYFVWYDDNPKKPASDKLQEAIAAYTVRFSAAPNLALVNTADQIATSNVAVRYERTVQPNSFWLAFEDADRPAA